MKRDLTKVDGPNCYTERMNRESSAVLCGHIQLNRLEASTGYLDRCIVLGCVFVIETAEVRSRLPSCLTPKSMRPKNVQSESHELNSTD